jgi:hypothetical protein
MHRGERGTLYQSGHTLAQVVLGARGRARRPSAGTGEVVIRFLLRERKNPRDGRRAGVVGGRECAGFSRAHSADLAGWIHFAVHGCNSFFYMGKIFEFLPKY